MNDSLAGAMIGHCVGDFLLQTDLMASRKKQDSIVCFAHSLLWAVIVCVFARWSFWYGGVFLFIGHFAIDRSQFIPWWMRFMEQSKFMMQPLAPWSLIVVDNTWHLVQIWLVWRFLI